MNLFEKGKKKTHEEFELIVSMYDVAANQHMPLERVANLNIAWRMVDFRLKDLAVPRSEYLLVVHGEMIKGRLAEAFQPYLEEVFYNCNDKGVMSLQGVKTLVNDMHKQGLVNE